MKEKIEDIRRILDEIESEVPSEDEAALQRNFSAFELPEIIQDIVDYLMPLLTPYEITVYLHAFRHSILEHGIQHVRLSIRGMRGIAHSASGQSSQISYGAIEKNVNRLVEVGAMKKEGEANRDGTLYKVMIPEEIEFCRKAMQQKEKQETVAIDVRKEADFYNVRENRIKIYERDEYKCGYCEKQLTRFTATLDHITPVSEGGDNSYENLLTACRECNAKKNKKPLGDFLAEQG